MNDSEAREKMLELVYGELDAAEADALGAHLGARPELQAELDALRRARKALVLHRADEPAPPAGAWVGAAAPRLRIGRWLGVGAAAAAVVLAAVGVWMFLEGTGRPALAENIEIKRLNVSLTILSEPEWASSRGFRAPIHQAGQMQMPEPAGQYGYQVTIPGQMPPMSWLGWQGLALVRDQRLIANLPRGAAEVRFQAVPAAILPDTVRLRSLDDPEGLAILEQNYQYDLASAEAVLRRYVDKPLTAVFKEGGMVRGELLSFDASSLLLRPAGQGPRSLARDKVRSIVMPELPRGLLTRPTLVWLLNNRAAARQQFEVAYMTRGLSWRADYVLKLHPGDRPAPVAAGRNPEIIDTANLVGYATVSNHSGVAYENAELKLMAGDVNLIREEPKQEAEWLGRNNAAKPGEAGAPQFKEKAFFEYHLYTLARPTTLRSAETKQIELVSGSGLKLRRLYVYDRGAHATAARVVSEFENSEANGLGKPLPKGVVRLYAPDPTGRQAFVSKAHIDHTPKDEKIRLGWAFAFDIACSARRTDYRRRSQWDHYEKWAYSLRNHKDHAVTITVVVRVPKATYKFECDRPWRMPEVGRIEMDVPVKADAAEKVVFAYYYNTRSGGGLKSPHPAQAITTAPPPAPTGAVKPLAEAEALKKEALKKRLAEERPK